MYTDCLSIFDFLAKVNRMTERRLMIDIKSVREAYLGREIENIMFISSGCNPADALKKVKMNSYLDETIRT